MNCSTLLLIAVAFFLALTGPALADTRSVAIELLAKLRQSGGTDSFADELHSLDATLAKAERYSQLNDPQNAERYYTLAIQKGTLLQQRQSASVSVTSVPLIQKPVSSLGMQSSAPGSEQRPEYISSRLVGTSGTYTTVKGDTIRLVAGKLGVSRTQLTVMNGLSPKDGLKAGQVLQYNNRRIIPEHRIKDGIVINIPDRMLYLFQQGTMSFSTAVALGTPTKTDQFVWQTPTGRFKIVNKAKDPTWTVPPSIQEEMRLEGKEVITSIPPGPTNPLGKYAIKTSLPGILIHSTTKPWSIYTYASHGCIRVYPERMEELFNLVKVNITGEIIYQPVKLAVTDDGRILLEAHGDIYNKTKGLATAAQALIRASKLEDKVDWEKVKRVVSRKSGVAEEITLTSAEAQQQIDTIPTQSPS
jgi:L,D-transpeptidase ErfK/SrfK